MFNVSTVTCCPAWSRRLDHRSQQHAATTERSQGVPGTHTARSPFSGPQQAHNTLAAVAEGGSGSEASRSASPAAKEDVAGASPPGFVMPDELLFGEGCSRTLEGLASLACSPEGVRLAHARIGQLGRHQVLRWSVMP